MSRQLTILMLGGAKRVAMGRLLADAARRRGLTPRLLSYELSAEVPVAEIADVVVGLKWSDPGLAADLERVCEANGVDVIIPFVDRAVEVAASYGEAHPGVFVPACAPGSADAMFDKITLAAIFRECGLPVPADFTAPAPADFPVIAKPRRGSASQGIKVFMTPEEFADDPASPDDYLIQSYVGRREEYTVDCYVARDGRICAVSPRRRDAVLGGEVVDSTTLADEDVAGLARLTLGRLGLRGAVTVQMLRDLDTRRLMLMEINPRLGGGAVLSVKAGADIAGMIVDEAIGLAPQPMAAEPGVRMVRYLADVIFRP